MSSRPVVFEGANLGLVLAVVALCLAAGLLFLGPGSTRVDEAREALAENEKRLAVWNRQRVDARPVGEGERASWDRDYARLSQLGPLAEDDDAALMAWVAARLDAPSVRDLQVSRTQKAEDDGNDGEASGALLAPAPDGSLDWSIEPVPVHVRFDARYADVSLLLRRLEAELSPLKIEKLDLRRRYPDVRVELDLTLWTRRRADS